MHIQYRIYSHTVMNTSERVEQKAEEHREGRTRINLRKKRKTTQGGSCRQPKSCGAGKNDFTLRILWENTVVGTNVDWISLCGICGIPLKLKRSLIPLCEALIICTNSRRRSVNGGMKMLFADSSQPFNG